MDYDSLVNDLQTYMLRTDDPYLAKIPDLIQQGIIRIYNNAKDLGFENFIRLDLSQNQFAIAKPSNWRETISFNIVDGDNNKVFLPQRSYEFCRTYYPNPGDVEAPKYYCDTIISQDSTAYDSWLVVPSSDSNYFVEIIYAGIPLFNEENSTNFLTFRYPSLLLYSCLLEAALFLDDEEKKIRYDEMFNKELETINRMNVDRTVDKITLRDKS